MERLLKTPAPEPVSLEEAKDHLKLDTSNDNALVLMLIKLARERAEHLMGRPILPRTYGLHLDAFPVDTEPVELSSTDVIAINSVSYRSNTGALIVLPETDYVLLGKERLAAPNGWPLGRAVEIEFSAGMFADVATVPSSIKQWMLMLIGTLYVNRESLSDGRLKELPRTYADGLLDEWRIVRV